jgi:hypothetical protein
MTVQNFLLMTGNMLPRKVVYKDALNSVIYYADAKHWTALTDPFWRVMKWTLDADGDIVDIVETDWYNNLATDLSVVQSLSYS